jgi:hypothetical protein
MSDRPGSHVFNYVHTDIPAGMRIADWRARRAADRVWARRAACAARRRRRRRLLLRWLAWPRAAMPRPPFGGPAAQR